MTVMGNRDIIEISLRGHVTDTGNRDITERSYDGHLTVTGYRMAKLPGHRRLPQPLQPVLNQFKNRFKLVLNWFAISNKFVIIF